VKSKQNELAGGCRRKASQDDGMLKWIGGKMNLRSITMMLAMLLVFFSVTGANAQQQMGPPTAAQVDAQKREVRMEEVRKIASNSGMAVSASPTDGAKSGEVALPDLTKVVPTTTDPGKLSNSIQILLLLSVLALAPSILLMTTCFTRIIIVMSLLRQALGAAQLPPNQVMIGISLFVTFLVMGPTWSKINQEAIQPYNNNQISQTVAFERAVGCMREFMIKQIVAAHNEDDVYLFHSYSSKETPKNWEDVSTTTLIPAFILSELKVAFLMGFRIYLPFLIIDMVISSVLISVGMQLLPPVLVSLPFKLLLFVLVDGWHLVVSTLLASFS
jgi:flagellar biosynthetic protein FliP